MQKRFLSLLTAAALVFCCFPLRVHAAAALDFEVGRATAEAKTGETITVPVTAKTNPGYGSGVIDVNWDSDALTLTNVEFSAERAPDNGSAEIVSDGSYCLSFGDDYATENFIGCFKEAIGFEPVPLTPEYLCLTKYNIDPEQPGVNNGYYPQQKTYQVGVKITF